MTPVLDQAALEKLAEIGEKLFEEIKQKNDLPAGVWVTINCEPGSKNYGEFVHAPLPSESMDIFKSKFGDDLSWTTQTDWSIEYVSRAV